MRAFQSRPRLRWIIPAVAAAALVAGGAVAGTAVAEPSLPERSAEQLVAEVAQTRPTQFSGTAETRAELGLPALPGSRRGSDFEALLAGKNTIRVWAGNEDQSRLAVQGTFGESDLIRNGSDVWLWNSQEKTAVHSTISDRGERPSDEPALTPQQLAAEAIAAIEPTTEVSVARNVTVAGRAAYELVLQPKDDRSLIEQVRIAVDGERFLPLRVQVYGEGADQPSVEAAFTQIDFSAPDPSVFDFTPPPGTDVKREPTDRNEKPARPDHDKNAKRDRGSKDAGEPTVIGKGWTAVYLADGGDAGELTDNATLEALPRVSGAWGSGRLFSSRLVSAVITDDGRVAAGAVRPEVLYDALGR
ncbi:outer membrane lipoprotein carrier protein LolA [Microlunatus sp. GCM10028923]|uniref:LolA family protein n=1 Tax=Microlunatus sp. GCM10028923 TaxID=3273400 RepID=UPI00360A73FE